MNSIRDCEREPTTGDSAPPQIEKAIGAGDDKIGGDNPAPWYGYGAADVCDGGAGVNSYVNCP